MSVVCPDGHTSESTDYCDVCGLPIGASVGVGAGAASSGGVSTAPPSPPPSGAGPSGAAAPAPAERECPNCGGTSAADALFCEDCGYDFTTGALPPPLSPLSLDAPVPTGGSPSSTPAVATPPPAAPPATSQAPSTASSTAPSTAPSTVEWVAEVWVDPDWYVTQESEEACPSAGMPRVVPLVGKSLLIGRHSRSRGITPQIDCGIDSGVSRRHAQLTTDGQRWWIEDLQSSNGTYVGAAGEPLPTSALPPGQRVEFDSGDRIYVGAWTRLVIRRATPDEQQSLGASS